MILSHYNYLIVCNDLYGLVCARLLQNKGFSCLIISKRSKLKYNNCPRIFYTLDKQVKDFINQYLDFNEFYKNTYICIDNYNDEYHKVSLNQYNELIEKIINGFNKDNQYDEAKIDFLLNTNFLDNKAKWLAKADKIIYCDSIDKLLNYKLGKLPLIDLNLKPNEQKTNDLYKQYVKILKDIYPNIIPGGCLGLQQYMDINDQIKSAINFVNQNNILVSKKEQFNQNSKLKIWVIGTHIDVTNERTQQLKLLSNSNYSVFITNDHYNKQNINLLNRFLSEFVGMYYVWINNLKSDYVGFCHYRRLINNDDINIQKLQLPNAIQYFYFVGLRSDDFTETPKTCKYNFLQRNKHIIVPQFIFDDITEYLDTQSIVSHEDILNYCNNDTVIYYTKEIYACSWSVFNDLMMFIYGYVSFISNKYNLTSYNDWVNHISTKIISFYKNLGINYANDIKHGSYLILYQHPRQYNKIFDEDEGLNQKCNNWRVYSYMIEDLISIYIGTRNTYLNNNK